MVGAVALTASKKRRGKGEMGGNGGQGVRNNVHDILDQMKPHVGDKQQFGDEYV